MTAYKGDYAEDSTIDFKFYTTTADDPPTPVTIAGSPSLAVYKDNSTTEITTGITLTVDFDSRTGCHHVRIDTSASASYTTGAYYTVVFTAGTVDGASVVGQAVGEFSIEKTYMRGTNSALLASSAPTNFSSMTITGGGAVTVGTNNDKTGYGLANDAITAATFDETTAFPLTQADSGSSAVARTGADGDTLETLSDEIAGVGGGSSVAWTDIVADNDDTVGSFGAQFAALFSKLPSRSYLTGTNESSGAIASADKTGYGLADDAITAAKFDESTAFPLKSADTGSTAVARTGADGDTLETLSDQLDGGISGQYEVRATVTYIPTGNKAQIAVWLERDGAKVDVLALDAAASCSVTVREHGAGTGASLFTEAGAAADVIDYVFEYEKATPGFTDNKNYELKATITADSVTHGPFSGRVDVVGA